MWQRSWAEVAPFYRFGVHTRTLISTTNAIESLNSRYRRATSACGHFPNETAALKRVYLATLALDPSGTARKRWTMKWKRVLNELDMAFDGRLTAQSDAANWTNESDTGTR
ncbi:transposase-like protein [Streptacidiphilus sp. MAP12-33]